MNVEHLAIVVMDQERSRRFYETYFGFDEGPATFHEDGTLIIRNGHGFSLALHPTDERPAMPSFFHFGFIVPDAGSVKELLERLRGDGFEIVEENNEPGYVSFKFFDPDGYKVEVAWGS